MWIHAVGTYNHQHRQDTKRFIVGTANMQTHLTAQISTQTTTTHTPLPETGATQHTVTCSLARTSQDKECSRLRYAAQKPSDDVWACACEHMQCCAKTQRRACKSCEIHVPASCMVTSLVKSNVAIVRHTREKSQSIPYPLTYGRAIRDRSRKQSTWAHSNPCASHMDSLLIKAHRDMHVLATTY